MDAQALSISGFTPFTTIDYPGKLSAVVFCRGCLWKCPYCHNADLQAFGNGEILWESVFAFLQKRAGLLSAVVFSGGEPTAQATLPAAMREAKALGYAIGLHSAGMIPERFSQALELADWVGFDIKAPFGNAYDFIAGKAGASEAALSSLKQLLASNKPYQLRTTVDPALLSKDDIETINRQLAELGAPPTLQQSLNALA
mgnify:CR=1 FL=1